MHTLARKSPYILICLSIVAAFTAAAHRCHAATPAVARNSIVLNDLKQHISFLASDTLEGREAGTRGGQAAAAYLANEFRKLGLTPAGDEQDFFQEFGQGFRNILALLPGSDPEKRHEVILLGGHYDHVGYGNSTNSFGPFGQIHNGADDNASGTAAILEVAEALSQLDTRPQRSILFAFWDAEEAGLLGSAHWVQHPTLRLDRVKLAMNVDMVGRMQDERVITYGVQTASSLRRSVGFANQLTSLKIDFDPTHRDDSDHWSFFQRQIPYLMLHTGDHADYHRPSDDVERLNYDGLYRLTQMMYELTRMTADTVELGAFQDGSRRQHRGESSAHATSTKQPSRLGLAWHARSEPDESFRVAHVVPGSPAAESGLREGDQIVRINGHPPADVEDFQRSVLTAERQLGLQITRAGVADPFDVTVKLRGQPVRLGVQWRPDLTDPMTVIVTGVVLGSPAAQAGLQANDRLYPPKEWAASGTDWLRDMTEQSHDSITLTVDRAGHVAEVQLELLPVPAT